jgi:hypothetical protein
LVHVVAWLTQGPPEVSKIDNGATLHFNEEAATFDIFASLERSAIFGLVRFETASNEVKRMASRARPHPKHALSKYDNPCIAHEALG